MVKQILDTFDLLKLKKIFQRCQNPQMLPERWRETFILFLLIYQEKSCNMQFISAAILFVRISFKLSSNGNGNFPTLSVKKAQCEVQ